MKASETRAGDVLLGFSAVARSEGIGLVVAAHLATACGPVAETCDENDARLRGTPGYQLAALSESTSVVVERSIDLELGTEPRYASILSDACGRDPVDIDGRIVTVSGTPYLWRDRMLHWVDTGLSPPVRHTVVESDFEHVHEVAGGIVSKTSNGIVFRDAPSDPNGASAILLDRFAATDDLGDVCERDCLSVSDGPIEGQLLVDGDGVLAAAPGGPIYRFALPSGRRETVVPAPAETFVRLDNPDYLLWSARTDEGVWVRHRPSGTDRWLGDGTLFNNSHRIAYPWVAVQRVHGVQPFTILANVETEAEHDFRGRWQLAASLPKARLLMQNASTDTSVFFTPSSGISEGSEIPGSSFVQAVAGNVIIVARRELDTFDVLQVLRFDATTGAALDAEPFAIALPHTARLEWTKHGDALFLEVDDLVRRRPDGTLERLRSQVSEFWLREEAGVENVYTVSRGAPPQTRLRCRRLDEGHPSLAHSAWKRRRCAEHHRATVFDGPLGLTAWHRQACMPGRPDETRIARD